MEKITEQYNINSPKSERRDFLYEKIGAKIDVILDLRQFAKDNERIAIDDLDDVFEDKFEELMSKLESEEVVAGDSIESTRRSLELYREISLINRQENSIVGDSELASNHRRTEIIDELDSLKKDVDVQFIEKITLFLGDIYKKRKAVVEKEKEYSEDKEKFFEFVKNGTGLDLNGIPEDKYKIIFKGFSVIIELGVHVFEEYSLNDNVNGYHFGDSILIILKDREGKDKTLNHEENHNLSDSFTDDVKYSSSLIRELKIDIRVIEHFKSIKEKETEHRAKEGLKGTLLKYVSHNFSEIVADIDRMADREIATYLSNFIKSMEKIDMLLSETDDDIRDVLVEGVKNMETKFIKTLEKLSNIFFVSSQFGDTERAKGAIVLFGHDKVGRIENYFENLYGRDKYELYRRIQPIVCRGLYFSDINSILEGKMFEELLRIVNKKDGDAGRDVKESTVFVSEMKKHSGYVKFFDLDNLKRLEHLSETCILDEKVKNDFGKSIGSINWLEVVMNKPINIEDLKELDVHWKRIMGNLSLNDYSDVIEKSAGFALIFSNAMMKGYVESFEDLYKKWPYGKDSFVRTCAEVIVKQYSNLEKILEDDNCYLFLKRVGVMDRVEKSIS